MAFPVSLMCATSPSSTESWPSSHRTAGEYETLIMEACEQLKDCDCCFHIEGFGGEWPVDVGYDLSAFMEQFPELLVAVRKHRYAELDLYSQGIERTLEFYSQESPVKIRCLSRTSWVPDPEVEVIAREDLETMLMNLAVDFARALNGVRSPVAELMPFSDWRDGRV
jgi:hypothetical protein